MQYIERTHRSFVNDILERGKELVPFQFEGISAGLTHREYLVVVYSMLKKRPDNKVLSKMLLNYVRSTDKPVPEYIKQFAQDIAINMVIDPTINESRRVASSIASTSVFNHQYKGFIYAVNIDTMNIISFTDTKEIREHGFSPARVRDCVEGNAYTHKNHVFIRDNEEDESYERFKSAIRESPFGVSKETD